LPCKILPGSPDTRDRKPLSMSILQTTSKKY
jgi:hypothetical protein